MSAYATYEGFAAAWLKTRCMVAEDRNHGLRLLLSGDDHSGEMETPSQCEHCGSVSVIYDRDLGEIICEDCGTAVQLGTQKSDAIGVLNKMQVTSTTRQLLLEWCHWKAMKKAELAAVEAKYDPKLQHIRNQITGSFGLECKTCGREIMREGKVGDLPEYCRLHAKKARLDSGKKYRKNHPDRVKKTKQNYRKKIKKTCGQAGRENELGGKPLGPGELHGLGLGHHSNSPHLSMTDENDEAGI